MVAPFNEQEIQFADESVFCEVVRTFTTRIPVLAVRFDTQSGRATDRSLQSRLWESRPGFLMPRSGGAFEIDSYLCGAQMDTASGALVSTFDHKLDADGLGGGDLTEVGGLAGATATATALTNATGTRTRGAIVRVGKAGDGAALGQAAVIGATSTALLTGLPAAPGATDVVRACMMAYPTEALGTSKRFLLGFSGDAGAQYIAHGCHLASWQVRITHGDLPMLTRRYNYAYWEDYTVTIPSALALENCDASVSGGGSYFLQTVGTATRATEAAAEVSITTNFGIQPIIGQGGAFGRLQSIVGWVRVKASNDDPAGTLQLTVPWNTTKPTEYDADGSDSVQKHFLATLSVGEGTDASEGRHVVLYAPNMYPIGQRPTFTAWNNLRYQTVMYGLREGPDTTNDLTRSFLRIGRS